MRQIVDRFRQCEDGAVTVDWVVLTAAIVGVQIGVLVFDVRESLLGVMDNVSETVDEYGEALK